MTFVPDIVREMPTCGFRKPIGATTRSANASGASI